MARRHKLPPEVQETVRLRAGYRCQYCHASEQWQYVEFTMEHLIPIAAGGTSTIENLALACFACNRRKWDHRTEIDRDAGSEHQLFNPRADRWNEHFAWSADGLEIVRDPPRDRGLHVTTADAASLHVGQRMWILAVALHECVLVGQLLDLRGRHEPCVVELFA